jgi:hypothetical protein
MKFVRKKLKNFINDNKCSVFNDKTARFEVNFFIKIARIDSYRRDFSCYQFTV